MIDDDFHEPDDEVPYQDAETIDPTALVTVLSKLVLLGDDPYLRMQVTNIGVVDSFITQLETDLLRKLVEIERTPVADATFVSAQSQMWIFAVYELLRTWRQRANDVLRWEKNGSLTQKIEALEKDMGFAHFGRELRAKQLRRVLEDKTQVDRIAADIRRLHIPFRRLEFIRVALAKHEVKGRAESVALAPGYGRINRWSGSLDYEMESDGAVFGMISRRDIADEIRAIGNRTEGPTDEENKAFDAMMKSIPAPPFAKI